MSYTVDREEQLRSARRLDRFGSVASLTRQGFGNSLAEKQSKASKPAKKAAAKKTSEAKTAKKAAAKKTSKKS